MKRMLWKGLLALMLAGALQVAQAEVSITTIDTPGLTNKGSLEPFSTAEVTFTDGTEFLYSRLYEADFANPINYFALRWDVAEPEGVEGYTFQDWVTNPYPAFAIQFYDDQGNMHLPEASGGSENGGYAFADDFYSSVRFSLMSPRAYFLDTTGNQVIIGYPVNISQVLYGIDTSLMVPEPETYAMLATGLGMVGWVARRRKKLQPA